MNNEILDIPVVVSDYYVEYIIYVEYYYNETVDFNIRFKTIIDMLYR